MSFNYLQFLPLVVIAILVIVFVYLNVESRFFSWVKTYWFFSPSILRRWSTLFYLFGLGLLALNLLDLREAPKKVISKIPSQRTVILIDTSSSMLVEDVQPNRLEKAALLAKHFVKRAAGHTISVVLFSDFQKQIIPFTTDIDFLEARIGGLNDISLGKGSSNITSAIQESLTYLTVYEDGQKRVSGNILVISDAEENQEMFPIEIPEEVSVAVLAVGTLKGGPIPLRQSNGFLVGNKRYQGQEVISRLGEELLKNLAKTIKNYKYWVVQSYNLPTEDVLSFFGTAHKKKFDKGESTVRNPKFEYLVIPGIIFWALSLIFRFRPSFQIMGLFFLILSCSKQNEPQNKNDEEPSREEILETTLKEGRASILERLELAQVKSLDTENFKEALVLYQEVIDKYGIDMVSPVDLNNYAVNLFKEGNLVKGMEMMEHLFQKLPNDEVKKVARENVLIALLNQKGPGKGGQDKEKQDKNENDQNQQDQQNSQGEDSKEENAENQKDNGQDKQEDQSSNKNQSSSGRGSENQNSKGKDQENKSEESEEDKSGKNDQDKNLENQSQTNSAEKKSEENGVADKPNTSQSKKMLNAQLRQLLEDDRQLQEKFMDTETSNRRGKNKETKDW